MTSTLPPPSATARHHRDPWQHGDLWRIRPGVSVLAAVVIGGAAFDLGMRHPAGVLSFAAVALTVFASIVGGWIRHRGAAILLGLSLVPAAFLVIRDSDWLVPFNVLATLGLLLLAAATRPEPSGVGRAIGRLLRPIPALEPAARSTDLVRRSARSVPIGNAALGQRLLRIAKGVAIGAPIIALLASLLAASDALFRSWVDVPLNLEVIIGHTIAVTIGAALMAGLAGHGAWRPTHSRQNPPELIGATEATVILTGVVVVYLGFVIAQVVAIAGGAAYVERSTGLTYAEYARAGFFQLVAAAVLTLAVLVLLARHRRRATGPSARRLLILEQSTVVLTLVVVGVAIRRLFLYESEFGLTMLRLSTIIFALFIGLVFVIVGLALAGRLRHSPLTLILIVALTILGMVNVANPERLVAERNIDRFGGTPVLDVDYLVDRLGTDALPSILTDPVAAAAICQHPPTIDDRSITFNLGRTRAAKALNHTCALDL